MKKRLLSILLALCMVLTLLPGTAHAADEIAYPVTGGNIYFFASTITGCDPDVTEAIIPRRINGALVTSIYNGAFEDCINLTSVTIPDSVTSMGPFAFYGCTGLTSVTIPGSITTIEQDAFFGCSNLSSVTILRGAAIIGVSAFWRCSSLTSVTIPDSVTFINVQAFYECDSLTDVYYGGSESQWKQIIIGSKNDPLTNATIHYNTSVSTNTPSPPMTDETESTESFLNVNELDRPTVSNNIYGQHYSVSSSTTVKSYLYENVSGGLTRVEYVPAVPVPVTTNENGIWRVKELAEECIVVEDYSSDFEFQHSRFLPMELNIWGGFFAGKNYNFLVFGQENLEENDNKEVIRVVKYSKDWQRLGQASLYGANTTTPFYSGSLRFAEYDGVLYIRTSHRIYYNLSDGLRHQTNMTIVIREQDMTVTDSAHEVASYGSKYVSHSFNQFILIDREQRIVALDHGDGFPRSAVLSVFPAKAGTTNITDGRSTDVTIQSFPGAAGNNITGASLGGLAETTNGYVVAYSYNGYDGKGNSTTAADGSAHFAYVDKTRLSVVTKAISSTGVLTPILAPTGLNGGYILWNASDTNHTRGTDKLYYASYYDGGDVGEVKTATASLSDCQPILYNGKVVWYTTNNTVPTFYQLDRDGVTATKVKEVFDILLEGDDPDGGTVSGGGEYLEDSTVQITASSFENFGFSGWYEDGNLVSTDATYSFPAQGNRHLIAKFALVFTDVTKNNWFYDDVVYVARNGLMNGVGNQQFNPGGTTTRGMIMTILARIDGVDTSGSSPWYQAGMEWAVRTGVSDGTSPEVDITREQLAVMLWRYAGKPVATGSLSAYSDAGDIHNWADSAIIWAVQNGILNGSNSRLNPQSNATRAEAAAMLTRFCQNIET